MSRHTTDCTEVSSSFLFGTLKTVIGASLGRRVSLAGTVPIYPKFFTFCVGHTALVRKSTALHLAEHILGQADMGVLYPPIACDTGGAPRGVDVDVGFSHNKRGGWWYREPQNRYTLQIVPSGKERRGWTLGIALPGRSYPVGKESLPITGGCCVPSLPCRGGQATCR